MPLSAVLLNYKNKIWLQLLFVVKDIAVKQQILQFRLQIQHKEASHTSVLPAWLINFIIYISQRPVINVKLFFP